MTHQTMHSAANTGGAGRGIAFSQSMYPQTEPVRQRIHFEVENAENGYILRFGYEGLVGRTFVCSSPEELAQQIIASMVINKMEK